MYSPNAGNSLEFKYLGKFKSVFKTVENRVGQFAEISSEQKILCKCTFKPNICTAVPIVVSQMLGPSLQITVILENIPPGVKYKTKYST